MYAMGSTRVEVEVSYNCRKLSSWTAESSSIVSGSVSTRACNNENMGVFRVLFRVFFSSWMDWNGDWNEEVGEIEKPVRTQICLQMASRKEAGASFWNLEAREADSAPSRRDRRTEEGNESTIAIGAVDGWLSAIRVIF